jgi:RNA 2',3'-cyclic 3'-phosphodiesterase
MVRAFIAVDLDPGLKSALEAIVGDLGKAPGSGSVRWVGSSGMHLTLKFLGEISDEQAAQVSSALGEVVLRHRAFELTLAGTGVFPPGRRDPRVLWVGITSVPPLLALQEDIEGVMDILGFEREKRRFHPHLTLGRVKFPSRLDLLILELNKYQDRSFGRMRVEKLTFFRSILKPAGAEYIVLKEFCLA